jgi:hypothetical protein
MIKHKERESGREKNLYAKCNWFRKSDKTLFRLLLSHFTYNFKMHKPLLGLLLTHFSSRLLYVPTFSSDFLGPKVLALSIVMDDGTNKIIIIIIIKARIWNKKNSKIKNLDEDMENILGIICSIKVTKGYVPNSVGI